MERENLSMYDDLVEAYHKLSAYKPPVLVVMHPADLAYFREADPLPAEINKIPGMPPFMGIETWPRVQIERGHPRMYKSWEAAKRDLRKILPDRDIMMLTKRIIFCNGWGN